MAIQYDAIVIGAGQSGPSLANRMNSERLQVAVLERYLYGGTCVNVGCVPPRPLSPVPVRPTWHAEAPNLA